MKRQNWNFNWNFCPEGGTPKKVNLPYDAMIFEDRIPNLKDGVNTGFFPGGKYLYTKTLEADEELLDKTVVLEFEGVYQKSKVYLNGEEVGGRIYGFSRFYADLTGKLKIGSNEIRVVADNTQMMNCRWYSGSGIYRDVNLYVGEKNHINLDGVYVVTKSCRPAVLSVEIDATKEKDMELVTEIAYKGVKVAEGKGSHCEITVPNARLWSSESPELYDLTVKLMDGDRVVDSYEEKYGIRLLTVDAKKGMQINGNTVKLRGGCIHHDHGPVGANSFKKAELRRARIMKEAGFNAIRTAHNPYSRAFLEACDEVGMYVMHESFDTWYSRKSDYDYGFYFRQEYEKDLTDMILLSRNHACVVMYGIGNEIMETGRPEGGEISRQLMAVCKKVDPSRPAINCINPLISGLAAMGIGMNDSAASPDDEGNPRQEAPDTKAAGSKLVNNLLTLSPKLMKIVGSPGRMNKISRESMESVDIVGFNYAKYLAKPMQKKHGGWVQACSETFAHAIRENWPFILENSWMVGDFCWTGWDYMGETGVGQPLYGVDNGTFTKPYPSISAGCGSVDLTGAICAQAEFSRTVWGQRKEPFIGVRPVNHVGEKYFLGLWRETDTIQNWSWKGMEGHAAEIEVFSNGSSVALFQNGKSLGKKRVREYKASYKTTYRPGELVAIAYDDKGNEIGRSSLKSAGKETVLAVRPEEKMICADGMDLAYFVINIADKKGSVKMLEDKLVTVKVNGAGELIGIGSGRVETTEKFTGNCYTTYEGRLIAVVRSNGQKGKIRLTATADGLNTVTCEIEAI